MQQTCKNSCWVHFLAESTLHFFTISSFLCTISEGNVTPSKKNSFLLLATLRVLPSRTLQCTREGALIITQDKDMQGKFNPGKVILICSLYKLFAIVHLF